MPDAQVRSPLYVPILARNDACGGDAAVLAEITDVVRQVLRDRTIELTPHTAMDDMEAWDSMSHIAILVEAECRFDVLFDLADVDAVSTVGHLMRLIQAKQASVATALD